VIYTPSGENEMPPLYFNPGGNKLKVNCVNIHSLKRTKRYDLLFGNFVEITPFGCRDIEF